MKLSKVAASVLALAVVVGTVYATSAKTDASQSAEQSVKQVLNNYADAVSKGDIDVMMKVTDDKRFDTDEEKRSVYKTNLAEGSTDVQVLSFKQESPEKFEATLRVKTKSAGTHELVYPVVKEGDAWKLVIEKRVVQPTGEQ